MSTELHQQPQQTSSSIIRHISFGIVYVDLMDERNDWTAAFLLSFVSSLPLDDKDFIIRIEF